jgi:hypothetical protein
MINNDNNRIRESEMEEFLRDERNKLGIKEGLIKQINDDQQRKVNTDLNERELKVNRKLIEKLDYAYL